MLDPLLIPLAALAIPIIVAPTSMAFKHAAKLRDLDHAERMRAMELGRLSPVNKSWSVPHKIAAWVGVGVPIIVMLAAAQATIEAGFHEEIWMFSGMVGIASVICGTVLAAQSRATEAREDSVAKPVYDREAFEFAGPHA